MNITYMEENVLRQSVPCFASVYRRQQPTAKNLIYDVKQNPGVDVSNLDKVWNLFEKSKLYPIYDGKIILYETLLCLRINELTKIQFLFIASIFRYFFEKPYAIKGLFYAGIEDIPFEYRILLVSLLYEYAPKYYLHGDEHSIIKRLYFRDGIKNYWERLRKKDASINQGDAYELFNTLYTKQVVSGSIDAGPYSDMDSALLYLKEKLNEYICNRA